MRGRADTVLEAWGWSCWGEAWPPCCISTILLGITMLLSEGEESGAIGVVVLLWARVNGL